MPSQHTAGGKFAVVDAEGRATRSGTTDPVHDHTVGLVQSRPPPQPRANWRGKNAGFRTTAAGGSAIAIRARVSPSCAQPHCGGRYAHSLVVGPRNLFDDEFLLAALPADAVAVMLSADGTRQLERRTARKLAAEVRIRELELRMQAVRLLRSTHAIVWHCVETTKSPFLLCTIGTPKAQACRTATGRATIDRRCLVPHS